MNNFNIVAAIVLIAMGLLYKIAMKFIDVQHHKIDLDLMKFQIETKIDSEILTLFDEFLSDCFDDYILDHPKIMEAVYISEQQELTIRNDMIDIVGDRISPFLYQKLSLYYNETILPDIIARRVYHLVTAYVVDKNSLKQSKDQLS